MKKEQIIYTAGIFDGEGWIGIGQGSSIDIRIVSTNKELIELLGSLWGGQLYQRKKVKNRLTAYDFVLRDREGVIKFIESIYPYLICKKSQVNETIKKHREIKSSNKRDNRSTTNWI